MILPSATYVFEAPVRRWRWLAVAAHVGTDGNELLHWPTAAVGEWRATYLFYMGYIG